MKKLLAISILLALAAVIFGCSSTAAPENDGRKAAQHQKADRSQDELSNETRNKPIQ